MNLVELAQRIRALRLERGLTLDEVVAGSGLTKSWLSKVENFRVTPSLPGLMQIAEGLGVPVAALIDGLDARPAFVKVRRGEGVRISRDREVSNIVYESLAHERTDRAMDPFVLVIPPGGGRSKAMAHEGEEFLHVVEGRVTFWHGTARHDLGAGDSLYFDASTPHRMTNTTKKPARVLCVHYLGSAETAASKATRRKSGKPTQRT